MLGVSRRIVSQWENCRRSFPPYLDLALSHIRTCMQLQAWFRSMPKPIKVPTKQQRAFHEAGHAVMAYLMKIPFSCVSIQKTDWVGGFVSLEPNAGGLPESLSPWERAERLACISVGAAVTHIKQEKRLDPYINLWSLNDLYQAGKAFVPLVQNETEELLCRSYITLKTYYLLVDHWHAVEKLAHALLKEHQIDYSRARAIIEGALGCTPDKP
jgi:hypothetical protein